MNSVTTPPGSGAVISQALPTPITIFPPNANVKSSQEDKEFVYEPEFRETFSKPTLKLRVQEFRAGKYTKRYIEAYLEFMVLSGMVNNLDYLEFKNIINLG